ncbi:hypothetical protein PMZ80_003053 [Knufia obscura]|uniref:Uncharacterized protein n=2 Tax=Knufia TaxID=430999 RepID=A0AAN8ECK9_9EURO|nr:hypothetical protein PMZ80_003053 [Knufia obscura]KAK5952359.1 hypothetical protein OHC33_006402 [Knufia fluminis]
MAPTDLPEQSVSSPSSVASSDDGFSVISGSELLEPQAADVPATVLSASSIVTQEITPTAPTPAIERLEITNIEAERDRALEALAEQQAADQATQDSIREQLKALTKDGEKEITDIPTLISRYQLGQQRVDIAESVALNLGKLTRKNRSEAFDKIRALEHDKKVLEDTIAAQAQALELAKEEAAQFRSKALYIENTDDDVNGKLRASCQTIEGLREEVESLGALARLRGEETANQAQKIEDLERKLHATTNEVTVTQKSETKLLEKVTGQAVEIDELKYDNKVLRLREEELECDIEERDEQLDDLHNEISTLEADKDDLENQVQDLNDEIEGLRDSIEDLKAQLANREGNVDETKEKLHNARWRGRRLKKQRDIARAAKNVGGR